MRLRPVRRATPYLGEPLREPTVVSIRRLVLRNIYQPPPQLGAARGAKIGVRQREFVAAPETRSWRLAGNQKRDALPQVVYGRGARFGRSGFETPTAKRPGFLSARAEDRAPRLRHSRGSRFLKAGFETPLAKRPGFLRREADRRESVLRHGRGARIFGHPLEPPPAPQEKLPRFLENLVVLFPTPILQPGRAKILRKIIDTPTERLSGQTRNKLSGTPPQTRNWGRAKIFGWPHDEPPPVVPVVTKPLWVVPPRSSPDRFAARGAKLLRKLHQTPIDKARLFLRNEHQDQAIQLRQFRGVAWTGRGRVEQGAIPEIFRMSRLDWPQIIKRVYDVDKNSLRVRLVSGPSPAGGTKLDAPQVFKMVYNDSEDFLRVISV